MDEEWSPFQDSSSFDGGTIKSDDATLTAFAQYLVRFVQEYAKVGIAIDPVAPQNEPTYTQCLAMAGRP